MKTLLAIDTGLEVTGRIAGYGNSVEKPVAEIVGTAINAGLGVLGILFLILLIIGGVQWMIASGDSGKVKKATSMIVNAAIAMAVIVGAYALSRFVISLLLTATQ